MSLKNSIKRLYNSDLYHGSRRSKRFFEGWYFKLISADESSALALIPGVAMDENGKQHAFIQILDGKKRQAEYIKFTFESFFAQEDRFLVKIGESQFSKNEVILNHEKIKGHLTFSKTIPWPSTLFSPGIMGPFSFFPFLECYHGIVSMNHIINGGLEYKNKAYDFTNGKGYAEKDWGHSFPEAYFWMQSNHFTNDKISVKAV
ncbi:MAG: hypothetical protein HKO66_11995 [Saprospiraceae bacterium]|nr:tocopherol cyclase family protein [Bacteroidia bacterium]NNL92951.1 hypothetical protein [Saprospiraceae bacterium]